MGSYSLKIPRARYDLLKRHVLDEAPSEAVGVLGIFMDAVMSVCPARNIHETPITHFHLNPDDQIRITAEIENMGWDWAVYHSHPQASARMSGEDLRWADPFHLHVIVGMKGSLTVRAYTVGGLSDRRLKEIGVEVI